MARIHLMTKEKNNGILYFAVNETYGDFSMGTKIEGQKPKIVNILLGQDKKAIDQSLALRAYLPNANVRNIYLKAPPGCEKFNGGVKALHDDYGWATTISFTQHPIYTDIQSSNEMKFHSYYRAYDYNIDQCDQMIETFYTEYRVLSRIMSNFFGKLDSIWGMLHCIFDGATFDYNKQELISLINLEKRFNQTKFWTYFKSRSKDRIYYTEMSKYIWLHNIHKFIKEHGIEIPNYTYGFNKIRQGSEYGLIRLFDLWDDYKILGQRKMLENI